MRAIYFDAFSGISGNMVIGAMLDSGLEPEPFFEGLKPLGIEAEDLIIDKRDKAGIRATYFNVRGEEEKLDGPRLGHHHEHDHHHEHNHDHEHDDHHHAHRGLLEVSECIDCSGFDEEVKTLAKRIYEALAEAEARVHGKALETVHFHEVGEMDAVIDILGAAYFITRTGAEAFFVGSINPGGGTVHCAHGEYPVPAPATAYLLEGLDAPLGGPDARVELTTPTGASILKGIDARYRPKPEGQVLKVAYGAGSRDLAHPNVLRVFFLETEEAMMPVWYSCNLDDMTGEALGFCMDKLFEAGARDVTFTPIFMKKNRPAQRLDVLTDTAHAETVKDLLFRHTTTLGIKKIPLEKIELPRIVRKEETEIGPVRTKYAQWGEGEKASPEYEDIKRLAEAHALSLSEVRRKWEMR